MSSTKPDIYNLSVVLVGQFNPAIITPSWLALKKLIRESEAEAADLNIVHPEISKFTLTFAEVQVTKDKFQINCANASEFDLVKDLVASIFTYLKETPVGGIGLNHIFHFKLKDKEEFRSFGNWLAPHDSWSKVLHNPGLLELKIVEEFKEGDPVRNFILINPSDKLRPFGVKFQFNYHIELSKIKGNPISEAILNNWERSFGRAEEVYSNMVKDYSNGENPK